MRADLEFDGRYRVKIEPTEPRGDSGHEAGRYQELLAERDREHRARITSYAAVDISSALENLPRIENGNLDVENTVKRLLAAYGIGQDSGAVSDLACIIEFVTRRHFAFPNFGSLRKNVGPRCVSYEATLAVFLRTTPQSLWPTRYDAASGERLVSPHVEARQALAWLTRFVKAQKGIQPRTRERALSELVTLRKAVSTLTHLPGAAR